MFGGMEGCLQEQEGRWVRHLELSHHEPNLFGQIVVEVSYDIAVTVDKNHSGSILS